MLRQTVSLYHNSSVCLDTRGTSRWDRNLAALHQVDIIPMTYLRSQCKRRDLLGIYSHKRFRLPECSVYKKSFALRVCDSRQFLT